MNTSQEEAIEAYKAAAEKAMAVARVNGRWDPAHPAAQAEVAAARKLRRVST